MTSEIFKEPAEVVRLWIHECERTLADRMVNKADLDRFTDMRVKTTKKYFADIPEVSPVPGLSSISLLMKCSSAWKLILKLRPNTSPVQMWSLLALCKSNHARLSLCNCSTNDIAYGWRQNRCCCSS